MLFMMLMNVNRAEFTTTKEDHVLSCFLLILVAKAVNMIQ